MKSEESKCAEMLKVFLDSEGHTVSFKNGPNPPDIVFHVGPEVWGVEHAVLCQYVSGQSTDLRRSKSTSLREMEISDAEIYAAGQRMKKNLEQRTDGRRQASWDVLMYFPIAKAHLRLIENEIVKAILDDDQAHVENLHDSRVHVHRSERSGFEIQMGTGFYYRSTLPGSSDSSSDVQATVDYSVERALRRKQPTPSIARGFDRYVLLLQPSYYFADADHVSWTLQHNLTLTTAFDDIFLVDGTTVARVGGKTNDP